jgi:hypothetical protein
MGTLMRPLELTIKALDDVIKANDVSETDVCGGKVDHDVEQIGIDTNRRRPFLNRPQSEKVSHLFSILRL